ncbi:hypothetical protein [Pseudomonas sp. B21-048]|uniref:hypothetical protein n=1 Tax=Pseudomonas sp. B21-048 TaxID=2895490 RepID=UPI002160A0F3|nr:hypothetical protein [Pseudomonas sp. B21-048]UVL01067.1 hypothetical protein LOY56_12300 [Pseudomonas sp. B21-048]
MAEYQAETPQCALAIYAQQIMRCRSVVLHLLATSFFISCAQCLWDAVGNFLGNLLRAQGAYSGGGCGDFDRLGVTVTLNRFK